MVNLENEGQTHLRMIFRITGCKHHTDKIIASILAPTISLQSHLNIRLHTGARVNVVLLTKILTFSRPGISKMFKNITFLELLPILLKIIKKISFDLAYLRLQA